MNIKGIIFDMDGTLLDTLEDIAVAVNSSLCKYGFPEHEVDEYRFMIGDGAHMIAKRALPSSQQADDKLIKEIRDDFLQYYNHNVAVYTHAYPGIKELLFELENQGLPLAIVTNKPHDLALECAQKLLPDCFDFVLGQKADLACKPDPAGALLAAEKLNLPAGSCMFVGDSYVDMQTANNAKMLAVGVLWGFRSQEELQSNGARHCVQQAEEILNLI